jgi:hypothetical protein
LILYKYPGSGAAPEGLCPGGRARLWVTPGRRYFTVERVKSEIRISKSETNLKFECSNAQNNQESIHFITVNLF